MRHNGSGFSAVELVITLFIAAIFLIAGYQVWGFTQKAGAESDQFAKASNVAYEYLRKYSTSGVGSCVASGPTTTQLSVDGLPNANVVVTASCPYGATIPITKVTSTVNYSSNQSKSVTHAIFTQ